jgi:hypothetical protein
VWKWSGGVVYNEFDSGVGVKVEEVLVQVELGFLKFSYFNPNIKLMAS